jgi:hypothetical protein
MEECFILLLMALSVAALAKRAQLWLGAMVALLFVTKIDTLTWIACLLFAYVLLERIVPWKICLIGIALSTPWIIYSLFTFGSVMPHTIGAKQVAYLPDEGFHLMDAVLLAVPEAYKDTPWVVILFGVFTYGSLVLSMWRISKTRDWLYLVFPLYCLTYTLALFASGTSVGLWTRWTVPFWGSLLVSFSYVVNDALRWLPKIQFASLRGRLGVTLIVLEVISLFSPFVYPNRKALEPRSFTEVAVWLRDHANPTQSVFLEPIGLIGYESGLYVHDYIGLVTPSVTKARKHWNRSNRWLAYYLKAQRPTYIVLRTVEVERNELIYASYEDRMFTPEEMSWFESTYIPIFETTSGPEIDRLVVFERRSIQSQTM